MKYWRLTLRGGDGCECIPLIEAEYLQEALRKRYDGRINDRCVYAFPADKGLLNYVSCICINDYGRRCDRRGHRYAYYSHVQG